MKPKHYVMISTCLLVLAASLAITACNSGGSSPTEPDNPAVAPVNGTINAGNPEMVNYASIDIEKSTNGVDADNAPGPSIPEGATVTWSYRITNNGNESLVGIAATDSDPDIGGLECPETTLGIGESMDCSSETDLAELGQYMNTATVTATTDPDGDAVEDSDDSHYLGVESGGSLIALDISKTTNDEDADNAPGPIVLVGDPITWRYFVTNNSDETAMDITVVDRPEGPVGCRITELAPGASMECAPKEGVARAGQYTNRARLEAVVGSETVSVTDDSHYFGSDPSVRIDKRTNGGDGLDLVIGCEVTWTYEITNDGNIDLENIVVEDNVLGEISCPQDTLAVGESMTCEAVGTVEEGSYANVGSVTAEDIVGNPTEEATDESSYTGVGWCTEIAANPNELWPPNHKLKPVDLDGTVCGDSATITITGVTQDEPVNGLGDGDTAPDAVIEGSGSVRLRSERAGGGNGRVYGIDYQAESDGVVCTGTAFVGVPHDQGGGSAVDDGQIYDSTDDF